MTCEIEKTLLSEYADGRLDAKRRELIEAHLACCPSCTALVGDFRAMGGLLRGMPVAQTSPQFEAQLAERLARTRYSPRQMPRLSRLTDWLRPAPSLWRPAVAFGAAAVTIAGVFLFQHPTAIMNIPQPMVEGALVTQCVQQHRTYVEAQPLSDPSAQSLANRLDETASALPAPLPGENDL